MHVYTTIIEHLLTLLLVNERNARQAEMISIVRRFQVAGGAHK